MITSKRGLAVMSICSAIASMAHAVPVSLTKLTGVTGGAPAATAVYGDDFSTVGIMDILSL